MNIIFNENCLLTMDRAELQNSVDLILTSPPYNTSRVGVSDDYSRRYDSYKDKLTDDDYINWSIDIFKSFNKVLKKNGCVLYNMSYSSENTHLMWLVIADIIRNTNFIVADCLIWKKSNAIPNNVSKNKMTRIIEYIFVFCRKEDFKTFHSNKKVVNRIKRTNQAIYENIYNFIEAKNNDGSNKLNKAVFSTDLVIKLLDIYGIQGGLIYDPFMGVGTTAKGSKLWGMYYVGSEISKEQVDYANNILSNSKVENKIHHGYQPEDVLDKTNPPKQEEIDDFWNN